MDKVFGILNHLTKLSITVTCKTHFLFLLIKISIKKQICKLLKLNRYIFVGLHVLHASTKY